MLVLTRYDTCLVAFFGSGSRDTMFLGIFSRFWAGPARTHHINSCFFFAGIFPSFLFLFLRPCSSLLLFSVPLEHVYIPYISFSCSLLRSLRHLCSVSFPNDVVSLYVFRLFCLACALCSRTRYASRFTCFALIHVRLFFDIISLSLLPHYLYRYISRVKNAERHWVY